MAKIRKKTTPLDLAAEDMLLAEEDLAAMRPALAVAPELVLQAITRKRKRRPAKPAKKKGKARKSSAKRARKAAPRRKRPKKVRRK